MVGSADYWDKTIDGAGLGWAPGCRGPRETRVFRLLPADAADWGRREGVATPPERRCDGGQAAGAAWPRRSSARTWDWRGA